MFIRQPHFKPVHSFQGAKNVNGPAHSAKNLSLTMSIGAHQTSSNLFPIQKGKQEPNRTINEANTSNPSDKYEKLQGEMKNISNQNIYLREENEHLKKELIQIKKETTIENSRNNERYGSVSPDVSNDLRGTIKKESGQMKELKLKLDMVSKQCKMYEEIIDKMDQRIKKLIHEQHKKTAEIEELRSQLVKTDQLRQKTNSLMKQYNDLESKFNADQLEWIKWKQSWLGEKQYYLTRIHQLEVATQRYFS